MYIFLFGDFPLQGTSEALGSHCSFYKMKGPSQELAEGRGLEQAAGGGKGGGVGEGV